MSLKEIFAVIIFVTITAAFGELASLLIQSELFNGPVMMKWSHMPPPRKFVVAGFPCIGAALGAALILCSGMSGKRRRITAPAAGPAPAPALEASIELPQRQPRNEEDLEAQVLQAQPAKLAHFARPGIATPLPSYTAADAEAPTAPPPTYSRNAF